MVETTLVGTSPEIYSPSFVANQLTQDMIVAGENLTRQLLRLKFEMTATTWFYLREPNIWRFVVATGKLRRNGPKSVYKEIQRIIARMPKDRPRVALQDVMIIDVSDSFVKELHGLLGSLEGLRDIRITNLTVNNLRIDDLHLYYLK